MRLPRGSLMTVRPREERTYKGVAYASKLEARRAQWLDMLSRGGNLRWWIRQVPFQLGTDPATIYRADFQSVWDIGIGEAEVTIEVEDVKPWNRKRKTYFAPRGFARTIELWKQYGPCDLRIVCFHDGGWRCEEIILGKKP